MKDWNLPDPSEKSGPYQLAIGLGFIVVIAAGLITGNWLVSLLVALAVTVMTALVASNADERTSLLHSVVPGALFCVISLFASAGSTTINAVFVNIVNVFESNESNESIVTALPPAGPSETTPANTKVAVTFVAGRQTEETVKQQAEPASQPTIKSVLQATLKEVSEKPAVPVVLARASFGTWVNMD